MVEIWKDARGCGRVQSFHESVRFLFGVIGINRYWTWQTQDVEQLELATGTYQSLHPFVIRDAWEIGDNAIASGILRVNDITFIIGKCQTLFDYPDGLLNGFAIGRWTLNLERQAPGGRRFPSQH